MNILKMTSYSLIALSILAIGCGKPAQVVTEVKTEVKQVLKDNRGITCQVYDLQRTVALMVDFDTLNDSPSDVIKLKELNSPDSAQSDVFQSFKGTNSEYLTEMFALDCTAKLNITEDGVHTFKLTSDDGAKLSLNGALIVNNDGLHGTSAVSANVNLTKGIYKIKVEYFNNMGHKSLILSYKRPGMVFEEVISGDRFIQ